MVPDVYWIITGSLGFDVGSAMVVVAGGDEGVPVVEADDLAQLGTGGATSRTVSSIGLPRNALHHEHAGRAGLLQHIFDFVALKPGLTVTSTMPASPAPNSSMIHSGRFCAQTAIRSPGLKRRSRARAVRCASV